MIEAAEEAAAAAGASAAAVAIAEGGGRPRSVQRLKQRVSARSLAPLLLWGALLLLSSYY
jgi:hypothetical protein